MVGEPEANGVSNEALLLAKKEVIKLLALTDDSLGQICGHIEGATSREACRDGFRRFNEIVRMFLVSAPDSGVNDQVCNAILSLGPSERLGSILERLPSVEEAITDYKTSVLKDLALSLCRSAVTRVVSEEQDDDLFDHFLSEHSTEAPDQQAFNAGHDSTGVEEAAYTFSRKRDSSNMMDDPVVQDVIPKKRRSSVPALASLSELSTDGNLGDAAKKRTI